MSGTSIIAQIFVPLRPVLLYSAGPVTALNGSRSNGIRQIDFVIFVIQYLTLYNVNMTYNLKLEDLKVLSTHLISLIMLKKLKVNYTL